MVTTLIDQTQPPFFNLAVCGIGNAGITALNTYSIHRGNFSRKTLTLFDYPLSHSDELVQPPILADLLDSCDVLFVLVDFSEKSAFHHVCTLKAELDILQQKPNLTFFVTLAHFTKEPHLQDLLCDGSHYIYVDYLSELLAPLDIFVAYTGTETTLFGIEYADLHAIISAHSKFYLTQLQKTGTEQLVAAHNAYLESIKKRRDLYNFIFSDMIRLDTMSDFRNLDKHESLVFQAVDYWNIPEQVFFMFSCTVDEKDKTSSCTTLFCLE